MIELDKSVKVVDNTKLNDFKACQRMCFYKHVCGLASGSEDRFHLEFGSAIHKALEHLHTNKFSDEAVFNACSSFTNDYINMCGGTGVFKAGKSLDSGLLAIAEYAQLYLDSRDWEVLFTEISGSAPVSSKYHIHFRMDMICRNDKGVFVMEHKTKGDVRSSNLRIALSEEYRMSPQIFTYFHALNCVYEPNNITDTIVNVILFKSKAREYVRIPVYHTNEEMQEWLTATEQYISEYNEQIDAIANEYQRYCGSPTMQLFRKNEQSCQRYFGCPFIDLCLSCTNPAKFLKEIPTGFTRKFWNPTDIPSNYRIDDKKVTHTEQKEGE